MMKRLMLDDEVGAVTADWLTLSAGIILLGVMVVFSVMNSAGYLMSEFDDLNSRYAKTEGVETAAASTFTADRRPEGVGLPNAASVSGAASQTGQEAFGGEVSPGSRIPR